MVSNTVLQWIKGLLSASNIEADSDANAICSFCARPRQQARYLISGDAAYICERCITTCVVLLEREDAEYGAIRRAAQELYEGSAEEQHEARACFAEVARRLAARSHTQRREHGMWAYAHGDIEEGLRSLLALPERARLPSDWIAVSAGFSECGDYDKAEAAIRGFTPDNAIDRAIVDLSLLAIELRRGSVSRERAETMLATLTRVQPTLAEQGFAVLSLEHNQAEVLLLAGRIEEAATRIEMLCAEEAPRAHAHLMAGVLAQARGQTTRARDAYTRAIESSRNAGIATEARKRRNALTGET
ncbi:MAG: ClpX C4-type zinc finger protein [Nannocystaceae bacterium]